MGVSAEVQQSPPPPAEADHETRIDQIENRRSTPGKTL